MKKVIDINEKKFIRDMENKFSKKIENAPVTNSIQDKFQLFRQIKGKISPKDLL